MESKYLETSKPFNQAVYGFCNSIIAYEKPFYQSQLQPFKIYAAKIRSSITDALRIYYHSFRTGYQLVLDQIADKKSSEEKERYQIPGRLEKTIQNLDDFSDVVDRKEVLQAVFDYSGQMMSEIYDLGIKFRQEKRLGESASVFIFLITLNPYVCSFWQGLGKVWHEQQLFEEALGAYLSSINCDPYRIGSYRDAVRCCLDNKNFEEAFVILNHGLTVVDYTEDENLTDFKKNILAMRAYIESLQRGG